MTLRRTGSPDTVVHPNINTYLYFPDVMGQPIILSENGERKRIRTTD